MEVVREEWEGPIGMVVDRGVSGKVRMIQKGEEGFEVEVQAGMRGEEGRGSGRAGSCQDRLREAIKR